MYFNGAGPSSSIGTSLTQEEAERRALAHSISMRYEMLEEVRPVIETLAYSDKYRKLLDEIWADKVKLDGRIKPEEERAMVKVKGQMLKEKKDPGAFLFLIRLEGRINENALADTGSDNNTMPYRIYEQLGRDNIMKEERNITMINYTKAEVTGRLVNDSNAIKEPPKKSRNKVVKLKGYADSDWAGSIDDSKSTSGYIFTLGSGVFCWNSKKQSVVAQSSAEAEYISVARAVNHAIWIRKLLSDLDLTQEGPTAIFCDNKSAIAIAENPVQHGRTKLINVKYHAIREAEKNRESRLLEKS
ncbi:retrotransposon ORF1 [Tanacetum coccineum]